MARGDYVDIKVRTPAGVDKERIQATSAGSDVHVSMPGRGELHVIVTEWDASNPPKARRTARFLASEVLSIVEGNAAVGDSGFDKPKLGQAKR